MREFRTRKEVYERVLRFAKAGRSAARSVSANEVPRRNLIDDQIFGKLAAAGIPSAALSRDEIFLRRVSLDLAGRIPTVGEIREFVADQDPEKRSKSIDAC